MKLFFLFIIGLCFGSFLSATASREGNKKSNWHGRSFCPHCHRKLTAADLIPVLSFIFLKGRCRTCRKPIGWREPVVELTTGLAFLTVGIIHHGTIDLLLARDLILTIFLVLLFLTDVYHGLLPHRFTIVATVVALCFNLTPLNPSSPPLTSLNLLTGIIICGGFFYLQHLISHGRWVGGGDIGMGIFLGAALGAWYGIWALGLAYVLGALVAIILLATKKMTLKSAMPFGPFLAVAGWIMLMITAQLF